MGGTACCVTKKADVMVEMDNNRKKKSIKSQEKQLVAGVGTSGQIAAVTMGSAGEGAKPSQATQDAFGTIDVDGMQRQS